jgi:hypothetical protein
MSVNIILKDKEYPPVISKLKGIELNKPSSSFLNQNTGQQLSTFHHEALNITFFNIISSASATVYCKIQVIGKVGILTVPTFTLGGPPSSNTDFISTNAFFDADTAPYGYLPNTDSLQLNGLCSITSTPNPVYIILRMGVNATSSYIHIEPVLGTWSSVNPITVYGFTLVYSL